MVVSWNFIFLIRYILKDISKDTFPRMPYTQARREGEGGATGASANHTPPPPLTTTTTTIKGKGISVLRLSIFEGPFLEGPPFVDSCGIFWTKLCDSRCILPNVLHFYLPCFLTNHPQNARNAV